jgi:hypothetical protein
VTAPRPDTAPRISGEAGVATLDGGRYPAHRIAFTKEADLSEKRVLAGEAFPKRRVPVSSSKGFEHVQGKLPRGEAPTPSGP